MKVIISHDVDHITVWEHRYDLIIPKLLARHTIDFISKRISIDQYLTVFPEIWRNKWQYLDEIMSFNQDYGVPATFFLGIDNGLGLAYNQRNATYWINKVASKGFEVGVHGICFNNIEGIIKEYADFRRISGQSNFGIRMHYLRKTPTTIKMLSLAGYLYDTSQYGLKLPWKCGPLWEIPTSLMDANIFHQDSKYLSVSLSRAQELTIQLINRANDLKVPYLSILFHDRHFCPPFQKWQEWYIWLIEYLKASSLEFINYKQAINELENHN